MKPHNDRQPDPLPAAKPHAAAARTANFWLPVFLLLAVTFLAYGPVWRADFIWDDEIMLTRNAVIQAPDGLRTIWLSTALPDYFPMTSTVLWFEWRLFGAQPLGYHLVNLGLHSLSAVWLWRVLARLNIPGAWLAAAIFALHPVNVESVAWVTELKNTLAMFFFMLTLWSWVRGASGVGCQVSGVGKDSRSEPRSVHRYWLSLIFFALALLSKTAVAPLPVVLLALVWWSRGRIAWRDFLRVIPFFAAAAALAVVTIWFQYHRAIGSTIVRTDSFTSRLAAAGWAVWFYLFKVVLPVKLSFIYPRWQVNVSSLLAWLPGLLASLSFGAAWSNRQRWGRAGFFALGYFVVMLLPVLGFLNISFMRYSLVADRWQYFAIIGPVALVAAGLTALIRRGANCGATASWTAPALWRLSCFQSGGPPQPKTWRFIHCPLPHAAICGTLLATLGALTFHRATTFASLENLWRDTLAKNPGSAMAHTDLANLLIQKGHAEEAITHYQAALKLEPDYDLANYNYGFVLLQQGRLNESIVLLQKAVAVQPDSAPAHYHLGGALLQRGHVIEATTQFRHALKLQPGSSEIQNSLGDVLLRQGLIEEAVVHFEAALKIQPEFPNALSNLGIARFQQGKPAEAVACFQHALKLQPDFVEGHVNLAKALVLQGQAADAVTHLREALKLHPDDAATLSDLAWLLATWTQDSLRNGTEAFELARRADELTGSRQPEVLRTLAAACAECARFADAISVAQRARDLASGPDATALAEALRNDLALYRAGSPVREGPKPETPNPNAE